MAKKKYIEAEAAYPLAKKICDAIDSKEFQRLNFGMRILDWIDDIPAAEVRPVRRGKWIPVTNGRGGFECDQCHNYAPSYQDGVEWLSGFCPNCGADMREES